MKKRRLLKLAKLLEKDAKNKKGVKFDLNTWGYSSSKRPKANCNTTACAIGLACVSGTFKNEGLSYKMSEDGYQIIPIYKDKSVGNLITSFPAVAEFFEITFRECDDLFIYSSYTPEEREGANGELAVAKRIREFVNDKQ